LKRRVETGAWTAGLDGRPPLTVEDLEQTDNAVAVMGVEPILEALRQGADVIIAGRACDPAIFAAPLGWPATIRPSRILPGSCLSARRSAPSLSQGKRASWAQWTGTGLCLNP